MKNDTFKNNVIDLIKSKKSNICVGLDSDYERLPSIVKKNNSITNAIFLFNKKLIDATINHVVSYKLNVSFYAGYGLAGLKAMIKTNKYIKSRSNLPIIADCKRSEMKRSAELVAKEIFSEFYFDALTVTPWFGYDTIEPYTKENGKAVFVLCHDSNPSAGEIQDLRLINGNYVYEAVTKLVVNTWNKSGNVLIEAPLTYPHVLSKIIKIAGNKQFFLIAGLGAQGGKIEALSELKEKNFIVSASRSIIFASHKSDFDEKAAQIVLAYKNIINKLIY